MKVMIVRYRRPEVAHLTQDPKTGRWNGVGPDGSHANADSKEECADKLSGVFAGAYTPTTP